MCYSVFRKIKTVVKKFNLDSRLVKLFDNITPILPSEWLKESLEMSLMMPLMNEKTKAERIISPILLEVVKHYKSQVS